MTTTPVATPSATVPKEIIDELSGEESLTPRQEKFLSVLFDEAEGDFRTAMDLAGYAKNTPVADVLRPLQDQVIEATKAYLALNTPRAVVELLSIYKNPSRPGAANIINVSKELLDRGGVTKKTEVTQTKEVRNVFILPEKTSLPKEIVIDHDPDDQSTQS